MKKKVLFIMHMPPPVHGAAMMGQYIHDSKLINDRFECRYVNPSLSSNVANVGKVSLGKIIFMLKNILHIVKTAKTFKPDIVYFTSTAGGWGTGRDWTVVSLLKRCKCPIVLHMHNKGVKNFSDKHPLARLAYKGLFGKSKVILLAKELYPDIQQYVSADDVYYCPNGMPVTSQSDFARTSVNDTYTFLFLSNMIRTKGVIDVLKACAVLKGKGIKFQCNFVGKWSTVSEEEFYALVKELNIGNEVNYLGAKYGADKVAALKQADTLVFPTYYPGETFGLVLLEAMEYAMPCISTREGGIPSVVDEGETGFLVPAQDSMALADRMEWLILHPDQGLMMGRKGREKFLREFTLPTFENRMVEILESVGARKNNIQKE